MTKTRWMLISTLSLIMGGLGFALLGAYSRHSVQAQGSNLPKTVHYLPEGSKLVAYVDVRKLVYSPAYQTFENEHGHNFTHELQGFIQSTGLDPRQDLDSVVFAAGSHDGKPSGVAIITGHYDASKITGLLNAKGSPASDYRGVALYANPHKLQDRDGQPEVAGFLDATNLIFGHLEAVQEAIDAKLGTRAGITADTSFRQLLAQTHTDGTFWVVSTDTDFLSRLHAREAAQVVPQNLPQIQNFILDGDLGNIVSASLRSQCTDEQAAQNLGDFARGMVALGKMAAARDPNLAGLLNDVRISRDKSLVAVEFSVPFEDLKKLRRWHPGRQVAEGITAH